MQETDFVGYVAARMLAQVLLLLLTPLLARAMGVGIVRGLSAAVVWLRESPSLAPLQSASSPTEQHDEIAGSVHFTVGLLAYLAILFVGGVCLLKTGVPLAALSIAAWVPALPFVWGEARKISHELTSTLTPFGVLWFGVILAIGVSLVDSSSNISTGWINNYGDFAFHLGMISSIAFGENLPPQYHIFPGVPLSYPLFMNLWTASIWEIYPSYSMLGPIVAIQWVLVWLPLFPLLGGRRTEILPFAILFGGGSFLHLGEHSGALIQKGVFWSSFLTTIWVPQRTASLGILVLMTAFALFLKRGCQEKYLLPNAVDSLTIGIILGLGCYAHTHFSLVGILVIGAGITIRALKSAVHTTSYLPLVAPLSFGVGLLAMIPFLPWILGKSGIITFALGGALALPKELPIHVAVMEISTAWLSQAPLVLVLLLGLIITSKRGLEVGVILALFIAAHVVRLAVWEWDQLKILVGLYAGLIAVWAWDVRTAGYRHVLVCLFRFVFAWLLMIPSLWEWRSVLLEYKQHEIYSREQLDHALKIRAHTKPGDIIAEAPDHNATTTLTGRALFAGYEGTLSSHGLDYKDRFSNLRDLRTLASCHDRAPEQLCPDYLLWNDRSERFWQQRLPPKDFVESDVPSLLSFPKSE